MIEVKAYFGEWRESSKEEAVNLAKHIYNHSTLPKDKALEVINQKHVRGVTISECDIRAEQ